MSADRQSIRVPIVRTLADGSIEPNPLFHRSWDKLHSRCIEYPFAAAQLPSSGRVLDVGTAQADAFWIDWLTGLPLDVHATDWSAPRHTLAGLQFCRADIRRLPFADSSFDCIVAVSVIEHIGLSDPHVAGPVRPATDPRGDVAAVRELARLLAPGGRLVMTFPYGPRAAIVAGGTARCYSADTVTAFAEILELDRADYYEYQDARRPRLYPEMPPSVRGVARALIGLPRQVLTRGRSEPHAPEARGAVVWRRIPASRAAATHHGHIDGVLCGIWRKPHYPVR